MFASPAAIMPMQAGITYAVHEFGKEVSPDIYRIFVIGAIALINAISVATETKALTEKKYSSSPISSTLNIATDKPLVASLGSNAINYAQLSVLNPINAGALLTENGSLLLASAASTSIALGLWRTIMNTLIMQGKIDPVVNNIRKARETFTKRFKKTQR